MDEVTLAHKIQGYRPYRLAKTVLSGPACGVARDLGSRRPLAWRIGARRYSPISLSTLLSLIFFARHVHQAIENDLISSSSII
jgi:hypothetical protein